MTISSTKPAAVYMLASRLNRTLYIGVTSHLGKRIANLLRREKVFAYRYNGQRYDCGSKLSFCKPP